jgi:hypothetical protein
MAKSRKLLMVIFSLVVAGGFAYYCYGYVTAEARVKEICSQIKPGMPRGELEAFGTTHGLRSRNLPESGIYFMAETRTFGRYACKIVLERGAVKEAEYNFAD